MFSGDRSEDHCETESTAPGQLQSDQMLFVLLVGALKGRGGIYVNVQYIRLYICAATIDCLFTVRIYCQGRTNRGGLDREVFYQGDDRTGRWERIRGSDLMTLSTRTMKRFSSQNSQSRKPLA